MGSEISKEESQEENQLEQSQDDFLTNDSIGASFASYLENLSSDTDSTNRSGSGFFHSSNSQLGIESSFEVDGVDTLQVNSVDSAELDLASNSGTRTSFPSDGSGSASLQSYLRESSNLDISIGSALETSFESDAGSSKRKLYRVDSSVDSDAGRYLRESSNLDISIGSALETSFESDAGSSKRKPYRVDSSVDSDAGRVDSTDFVSSQNLGVITSSFDSNGRSDSLQSYVQSTIPEEFEISPSMYSGISERSTKDSRPINNIEIDTTIHSEGSDASTTFTNNESRMALWSYFASNSSLKSMDIGFLQGTVTRNEDDNEDDDDEKTSVSNTVNSDSSPEKEQDGDQPKKSPASILDVMKERCSIWHLVVILGILIIFISLLASMLSNGSKNDNVMTEANILPTLSPTSSGAENTSYPMISSSNETVETVIPAPTTIVLTSTSPTTNNPTILSPTLLAPATSTPASSRPITVAPATIKPTPNKFTPATTKPTPNNFTSPTLKPTPSPTTKPTPIPTTKQTSIPTLKPTLSPTTFAPTTGQPTTSFPTTSPSQSPTTGFPTKNPTFKPSSAKPTTTSQRIYNILSEYSSDLMDYKSAPGKAFQAMVSSPEGLTEYQLVQRFALLTLYYATEGPSSWINNGWDETNLGTCSFYGVKTCKRQAAGGIVLKLDLSNNNLKGTIPKEICHLEEIERFILSQNQLQGPIPSCLSNLQSLKTLDLNSNQLTGGLPAGLLYASSLKQLDLSQNQLTGNLDALFDDWTDGDYLTMNLVQLDVHSNKLTGTIPPVLQFLPTLVEKDFSDNFIATGK